MYNIEILRQKLGEDADVAASLNQGAKILNPAQNRVKLRDFADNGGKAPLVDDWDNPAISLRAIAMACLRDLARGAFFGPFGFTPAWSLPRLNSPMTLPILSADSQYFMLFSLCYVTPYVL
jgi:hypothetical protein